MELCEDLFCHISIRERTWDSRLVVIRKRDERLVVIRSVYLDISCISFPTALDMILTRNVVLNGSCAAVKVGKTIAQQPILPQFMMATPYCFRAYLFKILSALYKEKSR